MLFIGGTGGSGTRLVSLFCKKAGYYIGNNTNKSLDSMHLEPFYRNYTQTYLSGDGDQNEMKELLASCVDLHIGDDTNPMCSVKNPRSLLILPLIHSVYPDMKFIHVVRSGLSMSFSGNRRHVIRYGRFFVQGTGIDGESWSPELAMRVWSETNMEAYRYGTKHLGSNYFVVKYEDLCVEKVSVYEQLVEFLECPNSAIPSMTRKVKIPETWKRGRDKSKELICKLEEIGAEAINKFGYQFIHFESK